MSFSTIEEGLRRLLAPETADGEQCSRALYRHVAGEATAEEAEAFEVHLAECLSCREDLASFRSIDAGARPARALSLHRPVWAVAAAAFVLCVLAVGLWFGLRDRDRDVSEGFRIKGPYQVKVAVQRGDESFTASAESVFKSGDVLGFFYTAPEDRYLVILFSDELGQITRVFPAGPLVQMPAGVERPLPDGAVLEPGSGCEWIVAFFCKEPVEVNVLNDLLRRAVEARKPGCILGAIELDDASLQVVVLRREQS